MIFLQENLRELNTKWANPLWAAFAGFLLISLRCSCGNIIGKTIEGIIYESSFKVMTLNGRVIRDIASGGVSKDGQQLKWDGRDSEGNYVATGVYLLMIYHQDGKNTIEKITVINKS